MIDENDLTILKHDMFSKRVQDLMKQESLRILNQSYFERMRANHEKWKECMWPSMKAFKGFGGVILSIDELSKSLNIQKYEKLNLSDEINKITCFDISYEPVLHNIDDFKNQCLIEEIRNSRWRFRSPVLMTFKYSKHAKLRFLSDAMIDLVSKFGKLNVDVEKLRPKFKIR